MSESRKRRQNSALRTRSGSGDSSQRSSQQNRGKMNHSHSKINFQRQGSYDIVRKIVQEEGRSARNLIQWNVPVDQEDQSTHRKQAPHANPRSPGRRTPIPGARSGSVGSRSSKGVSDRENTPPPGKKLGPEDSGAKLSASGASRRGDLRARYWAFLFENLSRAVDEIYQTCEADESVVECKEVIMMLEQCTKDFKSLIERLQLLEAYNNAEEGQKPTSLAWEVRKSSPGKGLQPAATSKEHLSPSPSVIRSLNFSTQDPNAGNSWADKVKGSPPVLSTFTQQDPTGSFFPSQNGAPPLTSHSAIPILGITALSTTDDDQDGWETVHRGGRVKNRSSGGGSNAGHNVSYTTSTHKSTSLETEITRVCNMSPKHMLMRSQSGPPDLSRGAEIDDEEGFHGSTEAHDNEKENHPLSAQQQNNMRNMGLPLPGKPGAADKATKFPWSITSSKSLDRIDVSMSVTNFEQNKSPGHAELQQLRTVASRSRGLTRHAIRDASRADDDFSSDDERERDDPEEKLTKLLDKELETVEQMEEELEAEQEAALAEATQEEQSYLKEIELERNTEIIVDTEPETDGELGGTNSSADFCQQSLEQSLDPSIEWDTAPKQPKETGDQKKHLSWADMMEEPETRTPGRVVHMHEKLSSPSRKRCITEAKKRSEEKQMKARELREKLNAEKAERLHLLTGKVEEVRSWKGELLHQRKLTIERKMIRAEEKRQSQLRQKVRKAHEEENKANEIAFINTLEAQNKRHDIITKHQEVETRLQDLQEERQRKHEEKAAKEAAVEERRKALEAERLQRLQEMQDRRRQRASEFEARQQTRERERQEAARAKERTREERIAVLNAQQQAHIEVLQKKIQQKQDESARRHKENLENIREKAFEMSVLKHSTEDHNDAPRLVPYARKKLCNVCNILIPSEVYLMSHLRGRKHQLALKESGNGKELSRSEIEAFNLTNIADAPSDKPDPCVVHDKERQKALKKRCKKLRQRMTQR